MSVFFYVLTNNIMPIFILIFLGYFFSKKFNFDIQTLSKMNFFLFMPAFLLVNLYQTEIRLDMMVIMSFCLVFLITIDIISRITGKMLKFDLSKTNAFKNSIMFNNTGNIGLSLITLVFSSGIYVIDGQTPYLDEAQGVLIVVLIFANITLNTIGFYNASRGAMDGKQTLKKIFSMPTIYMIPIAFFMQKFQVDPTGWVVWPALIYLKNGLVPMALLTLGVQLSKTPFKITDKTIFLSSVMRLIMGPLLAMFFIHLFGFSGIVAQTLLISYSVPTAVNTALIAVEFKSNEAFSTQAVVLNTLLSAFTLTLFITISQMIYTI